MANLFEQRTVAGKPVYKVESHHHVLAAWAKVRRGLPAPPNLLTLDQHTDTLDPFLRHAFELRKGHKEDRELDEQTRLSLLAEIDFRAEQSVESAISRLRHDEHIQTATRSGILKTAFVFSLDGNPTESQEEIAYDKRHPYIFNRRTPPSEPPPSRPFTYSAPEHSIFHVHREGVVDCAEVEHDEDCCDKRESNQVIETVYLSARLARAQEMASSIGVPELQAEPYILDIDLDYFHTSKALNPDDAATFHSLIRNAVAITIATEPECTQAYWLGDGDAPVAEMLHLVYAHIESAQSTP